MLTIGNKIYSSTVPVNDQLVDAIAALPSPFSNLKEDRLATSKELLKVLNREIDLALKLNKESGIGILNHQAQATIDKISKLKKNLQGKTEVDYSLYNNTLFDLYDNFYPPLKDGENVLRIRKLILDGYQSRSDKDSYMILEGEVGFSGCEKIGTSNVWDCVVLIIRNKKTLKTALAHIDTECGEEQIANIFRYLEGGDKEVVLVGASGSADNNKRNVQEILKAILKSVSKGGNVSIQKSYILAKSRVNALVVDPTTLNIRSLIPGIRRNNNLNEYFSLSRMPLYGASSKKTEEKDNIGPIEIAFDLTKSKKYIPWESYKSTIGASYFTTFKYLSSNKDYSFTYNSFFSIKNNRLTVNTKGLELNLKKLEKAATSRSRDNRDVAFLSSSKLKIIIRLVQAYADAFNDLIDKIESSIPDTASDKTQIINNIFTKLRTKKIFVDEGAEVFNKILLDKITNELSKLFDNKQESVNEKELQKFYNYLDSQECKIPFSTKMGKPKKLKKMMGFIESKEYQEYSKSVKPIQGNKSEYVLSDMLHVAVQNNDKNLLESLFKYDINVDTKNKYNNTPLHLAVIDSNVQLIKFLLENNANVNEKNKYGNTPLHLAALSNNIEITELLLNYGAKVDERNDNDEMPLHFAASSGYKEIIEKLVTAGVDINARNKTDWTALMFAAQNGHLTAVEVLIKAGTDVSVHGGQDTAMNLAARNGHVGIVELLLNHSVKVDEQNKNNSTSLHFAAQKGHLAVVEALIKAGADISLKSNIRDNTSLHFAVEGNCVEMIKALLDADTNNSIVNEKNKDSNTPLYLAIMNIESKEQISNSITIIELLLQKGASIPLKDINSALDLNILIENCQAYIPLLELFAKYKPKDVEDFLSDKQDLTRKLSKENNLGKELKEIVDEVENEIASKRFHDNNISTLLDDLEMEPEKKKKIY